MRIYSILKKKWQRSCKKIALKDGRKGDVNVLIRRNMIPMMQEAQEPASSWESYC